MRKLKAFTPYTVIIILGAIVFAFFVISLAARFAGVKII